MDGVYATQHAFLLLGLTPGFLADGFSLRFSLYVSQMMGILLDMYIYIFYNIYIYIFYYIFILNNMFIIYIYTCCFCTYQDGNNTKNITPKEGLRRKKMKGFPAAFHFRIELT